MSVNIGRNIRANPDIYASQGQNISELLNFVIFLYMLSRKITYRTSRIMRKKLQLRSRSFQTAQINLLAPICIFKAKRLNLALEFAITAPINFAALLRRQSQYYLKFTAPPRRLTLKIYFL